MHLLFLFLPFVFVTTLADASSLTFTLPATVPPLRYSTRAFLTTNGTTLTAPLTRRNTFVFPLSSLTPASPSTHHQLHSHLADDTSSSDQSGSPTSVRTKWLLDIYSRDYDFQPLGLDTYPDGLVDVYKVQRGGIPVGEKMRVERGQHVAVNVRRTREYYEEREGFSPLSLLKNPMILIGVIGLAFVVGMPYLLENMDPETRREFEEQQKKSVFSGGASQPNPLQNFDVASWMAGRSSTPTPATTGSDVQKLGGRSTGRDSGGARRRG